MLYEFLTAEREGILFLCKTKLVEVSEERSTSDEMELGLPHFYDELVEVLRGDGEESEEKIARFTPDSADTSARRRGKESLKLGYTISQVVHGYGALCQSITEYAGRHSVAVTAREFNRLNFCLDVAIAEAVAEFSKGQRETASREEVQRLGFLAHEMRNALGNIAMAHQMIKRGMVGVAGSTNLVLEDSIRRMTDIIDRSLAEVRLRGQPVIDTKRCRVVDLVGSVEMIATFAAADKSIQMHIDVAPDLFVSADRHLMISAISNLVQNAIKFTKAEGHVWITGSAKDGRVLIEVRDQCGGLPAGKVEELFQPYTQRSVDRTGLGLGLAISTEAVALCHGRLSAKDIPEQGCIFTIDVPGILLPLRAKDAGEGIAGAVP